MVADKPHVYKVVELVGSSADGIDSAIENAIAGERNAAPSRLVRGKGDSRSPPRPCDRLVPGETRCRLSRRRRDEPGRLNLGMRSRRGS